MARVLDFVTYSDVLLCYHIACSRFFVVEYFANDFRKEAFGRDVEHTRTSIRRFIYKQHRSAKIIRRSCCVVCKWHITWNREISYYISQTVAPKSVS